MTSEQKMRKYFPGAEIDKMNIASGGRVANHYRVTIMPGRYAYGRMKSWAWKSAWESIIQDIELCPTELKAQGGNRG